MKHKSICKLLEKHGKTIQLNGSHQYARRYIASLGSYSLEWTTDAEQSEVEIIKLRHQGDKDELVSDYFGGWFVETLKEIIPYINA